MALELENIKPILEMLRKADGRPLSPGEQKRAMAHAKDHNILAAEAAVTLGYVDKAELLVSLRKQSIMRVEAANNDIGTIMKQGKQSAWLKTNWSIYECGAPDFTDAVVAVANVAYNIVVIANSHPSIAEDMAEVVDISHQLISALSFSEANKLTKEGLQKSWDKIATGLRVAVEKLGEAPEDADGNAIDLEDYIANRGRLIIEPHTKFINRLNMDTGANPDFVRSGEKVEKKPKSFDAAF